MNGQEESSALSPNWGQRHQVQLNLNSISSSMASWETSSAQSATENSPPDPSIADTSLLADEHDMLNKAVKALSHPDNISLNSASSVLTPSGASLDKLSDGHDNGPTSDVSTPDDQVAATFMLSPSLKTRLKVLDSSDEEEMNKSKQESSMRLKRKVSPRRTNNKMNFTCHSAQSSSYPSSITSEAAHVSSFDASPRFRCQKIRRRRSCMHHKRNLIERSITWKHDSLHEARRGKGCKDVSGGNQSLRPTYYFPSIIPDRYRLIINVSGKRCEMDTRVLACHPQTLLGDPDRRLQFYDAEKNEVFLDRHRGSFDAILDFYEKGMLRRPADIPIDLFNEEVRFYSFNRDTLEDYLRKEDILYVNKVKELPKGKIKRYIWNLFEDTDHSLGSKIVTTFSALVIVVSVIVFCLETVPSFHSLSHNVTESIESALCTCQQALTRDENVTCALNQYRNPDEPLQPLLSLYNFTEFDTRLRQTALQCKQTESLGLKYRFAIARCWLQMFDSFSSLESMLRVLNVTSSSVIRSDHNSTQRHLFEALLYMCPLLHNMSRRSRYDWYVLEAEMGSHAGVLFLTETGCIVWFVSELAIRFLCSPNKKTFFKSFLNIIDLLAILPYFITLVVATIETNTHLRPQTATILRTVRLVRMLRILKLSRYSRGFRILGLTLVRSTRVLFLLVFFQVVLAVLFSSIAYFVEDGEPGTKFTSIPESFWWALITMTTVGYGDVAPETILGKITGACCAILGILSISFPVPVIVSNFNYLYHNERDGGRLRPEDLMYNPDQLEFHVNSTNSDGATGFLDSAVGGDLHNEKNEDSKDFSRDCPHYDVYQQTELTFRKRSASIFFRNLKSEACQHVKGRDKNQSTAV